MLVGDYNYVLSVFISFVKINRLQLSTNHDEWKGL